MELKTDRVGTTNINKRGSKMIITKYNNSLDIDVYFPQYNYTVYNTTYKLFKDGAIKCPYEPSVFNIGYLGEGKYKASINCKQTKYYNNWSGMLARCYDVKHPNNNITYKGCTVCHEWHNFQNFSKWYEENYYEVPGQIMCLDKDLLIKGNKIYSPATCCIIPQNINKLLLKRQNKRGNYPIGVHKCNNKYTSFCGTGNKDKLKYLGLYNTPEEAFQMYKQYKEQLIKDIANKYKEYLPCKVYTALINYTVDIED